LPSEARKRLKWMDYYRQCQNISKTCRYFGIPRKTSTIGERDTILIICLLWRKEAGVPKEQDSGKFPERRNSVFLILDLRKKHIRYGKEKPKRLYQEIHQEPISSWKIQRAIEKHNLYYNPIKTEKLRKRRKYSQVKKRITDIIVIYLIKD
jgi:hypothetical protein